MLGVGSSTAKCSHKGCSLALPGPGPSRSSPRSPTQLAEPSHLATAGQSYCGARYACSLSAVSSPSAVYASPPRQPAGEVLIELADVHKRFGSKRVLQGCNIQIRRGEAVGIIGGSGSGKSTTLRLMAGLMAPDWGDVNIKGQKREGVLGDDPELGKLLQVGMVFQHSALFDSLTVGDNVGFLLREHSSLAPERIRELVAASLDAVGLHGVEHLYPSELSGGMQKRVALARAIIRDTDNPGPEQVIMYDEPTAGLDPVASTVVEDLIRSLQVARAAGQRSAAEVAGVASYIVVTHQHSTIRRAVDRLVFLHQGKVVWQGKTDDFDTTAEPIVAQFRSGHLDGPIRYD